MGGMIRGLILGRSKGSFSSAKNQNTTLATYPTTELDKRVLSPWAEHPSCEADHSPASGVVVKRQWRYTSTPPYTPALYGRDEFNFTWLSVFMNATSLHVFLNKGFDNKNVQLNYITHTNRPYGKITCPNRISSHYHADHIVFTDCVNYTITAAKTFTVSFTYFSFTTLCISEAHHKSDN